MNYNNEPEQFKKGTVVYRKKVSIPVEEKDLDKEIEEEEEEEKNQEEDTTHLSRREKRKRREQKLAKVKVRTKLVTEHRDLIGEEFWTENENLLGKAEA